MSCIEKRRESLLPIEPWEDGSWQGQLGEDTQGMGASVVPRCWSTEMGHAKETSHP